MIVFILVAILILCVLLRQTNIQFNNKKNEDNEISNIDKEFSKFQTNYYVMTPTELKFYKQLKKVTDKLDLTIFPQVDLERFIKVSDNNNRDRNKIKSRSVDFTIVSNKNCKILCCIELDDYKHNWQSVKRADEFKNYLFKKVNINLYRIQVKDYYNLEEIEKMLINNN